MGLLVVCGGTVSALPKSPEQPPQVILLIFFSKIRLEK
jgi:hypothetical protein